MHTQFLSTVMDDGAERLETEAGYEAKMAQKSYHVLLATQHTV